MHISWAGVIRELISFLQDHYGQIESVFPSSKLAGTTECECYCTLNSISGLLENRTDNSIGKQQRIWRKSNQKTTCRNQKSYHQLSLAIIANCEYKKRNFMKND